MEFSYQTGQMKWSLTLHIIYTLLYTLAKLLANYLQKVEVTPTNVDHFKVTNAVHQSIAILLCDVVSCFSWYSVLFWSDTQVQPLFLHILICEFMHRLMHCRNPFPFQSGSWAFMQTPPQSQVISLVSQSTFGAVISDQTSPTANAASACNSFSG